MIAEPREEVGMAMDVLLAEYAKSPVEYINGKLKPITPHLPYQSLIRQALFGMFLPYDEKELAVFIVGGYVLSSDGNWVTGSRVPDLTVYNRTRFIEYQAQVLDWLDKPSMLVPDLCVEVIAKTDLYWDVMEKIRAYLRDGVRIVWLIDPSARTVAVFTQGSQQSTTLEADDMLDGGAVVPSFSVRVGDIFAAKI
jgi:Uma2 family endonuclease